ncbi:MAG: hypothetical protein K6G52_05150 [Treponemataceae bacterium]|nr:hypothetical protein [Treponemataceae bacterium]
MGRKSIYPEELKSQVVAEYSANTCGYKFLARKYNLKRDTVRSWVLAAQNKLLKKKLTEKDETEAVN